jgi:hypothetical protein
MKYNFGIGKITSPLGIERIFPTVTIEDSLRYGWFFGAEINNISSNLDYVKEIVSKLESVLSGELNFYEGFGYEVYMIECDKEKALVKNIFEDDKIDAVIPTQEVYELMRDWRDYLIDYYKNSETTS